MFNLVGKRYLFLIISLIVILPGTISLIFKGFDVGIDFVGGSTLEFRPSKVIASTQSVTNLLEQVGLKEVQVNIGTDPSVAANQVFWVRLNTVIDSTVQSAIQKDLQTKYGTQISVVPNVVQYKSGNKTTAVTVYSITSFKSGAKPTVKEIESVLAKIPNTTLVTNTTAASPTPTAAPTATATAQAQASATAGAVANATGTVTAQATATSTAKSTATPSATATATPTATTTPAANIAVKLADVVQGQTNATINILTATTTDTSTERNIMSAFLSQNGAYLYTLSNSSVSGSVASDTIRNSVLAVITAAVLILLYVWFAFRKVQKPWRYGACAIIALLHDVLVVMGVFSILGWTLHIQIDSLFITALLTVVGFSVHDTIVVFDRIRENMQHRSSESFEQIVNASLVQTLARSLNTSLTVLFTLSALTLFGGASIQVFTFALLIGIFSGTYSSIFNASMLLVIWEKGELGLWRFNRDNQQRLPANRRRQARERELARNRS